MFEKTFFNSKKSKIIKMNLRGKFGQHFWAGAKGRKSVLGRLRAAAVGRFF